MFGLKRSDNPLVKYEVCEEDLSKCLNKNGRFIESLVPCNSDGSSDEKPDNRLWWAQKMPTDYAAKAWIDLTSSLTDPDRELMRAKEKLSKLLSAQKLSDKSEE